MFSNGTTSSRDYYYKSQHLLEGVPMSSRLCRPFFARFWDCSGVPWFSVEDAGRRPGRCWNVLCIRKNIRRAYREADKSRWGLPLWEELIVWFLILLFSIPPPPRPCHSSHLLLHPALLSPTPPPRKQCWGHVLPIPLLPENNVEEMLTHKIMTAIVSVLCDLPINMCSTLFRGKGGLDSIWI